MRNTLYEGYLGPRMPREVMLKRVQRVIREELTPLQRYTLLAYYFENQTMAQIARDMTEAAWNRLNKAIGRIEPILVLVSSLLVGLILLSVMLPLADILLVLG